MKIPFHECSSPRFMKRLVSGTHSSTFTKISVSWIQFTKIHKSIHFMNSARKDSWNIHSMNMVMKPHEKSHFMNTVPQHSWKYQFHEFGWPRFMKYSFHEHGHEGSWKESFHEHGHEGSWKESFHEHGSSTFMIISISWIWFTNIHESIHFMNSIHNDSWKHSFHEYCSNSFFKTLLLHYLNRVHNLVRELFNLKLFRLLQVKCILSINYSVLYP